MAFVGLLNGWVHRGPRRDVGHECANAQRTVADAALRVDKESHPAEGGDEVQDRRRERLNLLSLHVRREMAFRGIAETANLETLHGEGFDDPHPADCLL